MWKEIIYKPDNNSVAEILSDRYDYYMGFTFPVAEGLYNDFIVAGVAGQDPKYQERKFDILPDTEKSFWLDFADEIPVKFLSLKLFIRPFNEFCRTCIITEEEIDTFNNSDYGRYGIEIREEETIRKGKNISKKYDYPVKRSIVMPGNNIKQLVAELNWLIPRQLKKIGYEIIRQEEAFEIDLAIVQKLARAIHSRYLNEMNNKNAASAIINFYSPGSSSDKYAYDFDILPGEIKNANNDNAAHIPTKLLSVGFGIRQIRKGFKPVALHLDKTEIETMAKLEHLRWSWERRLNGWRFGSVRDDKKKTHPCLISYEELNESEKEKDRQLVKLIPALLLDIRYEAFPISPNRISRLSYAIKPHNSIRKILDDTRELNDQIRREVHLTPAVEERVMIRNRKIEEAIAEVEQSYNYAHYIQETFLPDDLFIRECFPESFVMFKPKDIISGDFYFFSRHDNLIIFAAADCTGHGIPGALLSTIGYGILDQAVNEIRLNDPSGILFHLYSKIHRFLRNDIAGSGMSDDMDIALCIFDIRKNILTYSGVKIPLYQVHNGELTEYKPVNIVGECIMKGGCAFTSEHIMLNHGDTIYLSSDGYSDQFGGTSHKRFTSSRLKCMLLNIQVSSMVEQNDILYEEIEKWREENNEDQTDDILVIGIKI
jgi:serine phosphatase RsbU (regulator of sigma subunit)